MEKVCQQHNDDGNDNGDSVWMNASVKLEKWDLGSRVEEVRLRFQKWDEGTRVRFSLGKGQVPWFFLKLALMALFQHSYRSKWR